MVEKRSHEEEQLQPEEVSRERISEDDYTEEEDYLNKNGSIQRELMGTVEEDIFHRHINEEQQIPFQILCNIISSDNQSDHRKGKISAENISMKHKSSKVKSQPVLQERVLFRDSPSSICDDAKAMKPGSIFQPYLPAEENKTYLKMISHPQISDERIDAVSPAFLPKYVDDQPIEDTSGKSEEINLEMREKGETDDELIKLAHITPLRKKESSVEESGSPKKEITFTKVHQYSHLEEDVYERPKGSTTRESIKEINFKEAKSQPETGTYDDNVVSETLNIPKDIYLMKPTQEHLEQEQEPQEQPIKADIMTQKISQIVKDYESYKEGMPLKEVPSPLMSQDHGPSRDESVSPTKDVMFTKVRKPFHLEGHVHEGTESSTAETAFNRIHLKEAKSQPELDTFDGNVVTEELTIPKGRYQMKHTQDHSVQPFKQVVREIKKSSSAREVKNMIPALSNDGESFILRVSDQKTDTLPHEEKDIMKPEHVPRIIENVGMTKKPFKTIEQMESETSYLNKRYIQGEKSLQSGVVLLPAHKTSELPKRLLKSRDDVEEEDSTEPLKVFEISKCDSEKSRFLKTEQFPCGEKCTQVYGEQSLDKKGLMCKMKPTSKMDLIQQQEFTLPVAASLRGIRDMVLRVCCIKNSLTLQRDFTLSNSFTLSC